eukprot:COSAG01_NODE_699_length_14176_cov_21.100590_5_plen_116_part_00
MPLYLRAQSQPYGRNRYLRRRLAELQALQSDLLAQMRIEQAKHHDARRGIRSMLRQATSSTRSATGHHGADQRRRPSEEMPRPIMWTSSAREVGSARSRQELSARISTVLSRELI